jgi:MauM/NapG family ferredoxin protein
MSATRRDFFKLGLSSAAQTLEHAARALWRAVPGEEHGLPEQPRSTWLRPPGALPEHAFLAACTRCNDCVAACPKWAVRKAGHELGPGLEGTPIILPAEQPCWMCKDMPCIPACEAGALRPLERPSDARMGTIEIRMGDCYAAQGSICETCAERCPTRPKAIRVAFGQAPELDLALCTGCGVCAWLCPAKAIDVAPHQGGGRRHCAE